MAEAIEHPLEPDPLTRGQSSSARGVPDPNPDQVPRASPLAHSPLKRAAIFLEMIKFQHTLFALPFAVVGMVLASASTHNRLWPGAWPTCWILAASVLARTAAMSFNRWADAELDAHNPRTSTRAIPAGLLSPRFALVVTLVCSLLFIIAAGMLNGLALALAPVALAVLLGYSYCKRFTSAAHLVLGLALGIAPIGAWVAVRGEVFDPVPLALGLAVLLWTAGFDIIYACQDVDVDRRERLHSIPATIGVPRALWLSRGFHLGAFIALAIVGIAAGLGLIYFAGVLAVGALLIAEHLIVRGGDLRQINLAFFTINSWVGVVICAATIADLLL